MSPRFPIPVIGLTGGIASGKSLVAKILREKCHLPVLDADQIARDLSSKEGKAAPQIQKAFGTLDRAKLRKRIFSDPQARAELEAILHPLIREESLKEISDLARAGAPFVIYEAALLIETGRYRDFDALLVVQSDLEKRISRLLERDGISREQALAIIQAQCSDQTRKRAATWAIENSGSVADLEQATLELMPRITEHLGRRS
ncbi:MAG: dephospho-CoA kinase [Bdellovibrionales bacterium]|nr:dephospho-CoA kinase [Bdellovibrionales bacterium]